MTKYKIGDVLKYRQNSNNETYHYSNIINIYAGKYYFSSYMPIYESSLEGKKEVSIGCIDSNKLIFKANKEETEDYMSTYNTKEEDDIKYFKKKAINAIIDDNFDSLLIAAKKLKLMEECLIIYRLTRNPQKNIWQGLPVADQ